MPVEGRLNRAYGFSIIELLVVIAIIGILSGILLPVFIACRESARSARCQSNLKQLYVAFELYVGDWSGVLPCPGGLKGDLSYWDQENGGGIDTYLKRGNRSGDSMYCCPSYTGNYKSEWSPRTYSMNSFLRQPPDVSYPASLKVLSGIRKSNVPEPERTILIYEGVPENRENTHGEGYVYRCGDWTCVRGYRWAKHYQKADVPWHRGRNNYMFLDGHMEARVPEKYPQFRGPTSPQNDLWHVYKEEYFRK